MDKKIAVKLFEDRNIRAVWDEDKEDWWFSVVDIVGALTGSIDAPNYWRVLKTRLKAEGNESITNCNALKMIAEDGKRRKTDVLDTEGVLRLVQSIPSPKAEPFKMWLAKVGAERIDETIDPEKAITRALNHYHRLGYSEDWINQRLRTIDARKLLTDEWKNSGITDPKDYATLTNIITKEWSGLTTKQYKNLKELKKENLRDNMTNTELVLNMLAEVATTDISKSRKPEGFHQSKQIAIEGGSIAGNARKELEKKTGQKVITSDNAKSLRQKQIADIRQTQNKQAEKEA